jgi:hypothetical protein
VARPADVGTARERLGHRDGGDRQLHAPRAAVHGGDQQDKQHQHAGPRASTLTLVSSPLTATQFNIYDYERIKSHAGVRTDLFRRAPRETLITDFFGSVAHVDVGPASTPAGPGGADAGATGAGARETAARTDPARASIWAGGGARANASSVAGAGASTQQQQQQMQAPLGVAQAAGTVSRWASVAGLGALAAVACLVRR